MNLPPNKDYLQLNDEVEELGFEETVDKIEPNGSPREANEDADYHLEPIVVEKIDPGVDHSQ